jgi:hypothetical protein
MMRPQITEHNALTNETTVRDMTEAEYEQLLADGWTPDEEPAEQPASNPAPEEPAEEA